MVAGCVANWGLVSIERNLELDHSKQSRVGPGTHFVRYFSPETAVKPTLQMF